MCVNESFCSMTIGGEWETQCLVALTMNCEETELKMIRFVWQVGYYHSPFGVRCHLRYKTSIESHTQSTHAWTPPRHHFHFSVVHPTRTPLPTVPALELLI